MNVDTRTDIYSLGVIMYELLVGQPPFDRNQLRQHGLDEILRVIREQEPLWPSLRFSSQGEAANQTAAYRQTDTSTLSRALRGDLDWVVMKALEKDRSRRYESASELAGDLQRLLSDEPVEARPPSIAYKLTKFARRNRIAVTLSSLLLSAVVAGASATTSLWLDAKEQDVLLRRTVQQYQHEVFDRLMERGLSGDRLEDADTETMIRSMPTDMMHALRAMSARNPGNFEQVVVHLEEAIKRRPSDAYRAMLWNAKVMQGHQENYEYEAVSFLLSRESVDPLENLFVGRALAFSDPTRGIERVNLAIKRHNTVHAQSALAELHAHNAAKFDNLSFASEAVEKSHAVYTVAPDNPGFLANLVWTHLVEATLQKRRGISNEAVVDDLRNLAEELSSQGQNDMGLLLAGTAFHFLGERRRAERAFDRAALGAGGKGFFAVFQAAMKSLNGKPNEAAEVLAERADDSGLNLGVYAESIALDPARRPEVLELCEKLKARKRPAISRGWIEPEAIQAIVEIGPSQTSSRDRIRNERYTSKWERSVLEFLSSAEETSDTAAKVLIHACESQHERAEAYHVIGLRYLAMGDTETAAAKLRNAYEKTSAPYWPIGFWSLALAERLKPASAPIPGDAELSQ